MAIFATSFLFAFRSITKKNWTNMINPKFFFHYFYTGFSQGVPLVPYISVAKYKCSEEMACSKINVPCSETLFQMENII
jgi:hypothetical protein